MPGAGAPPAEAAAVDVWHAEAAGAYSDEQSNGTSGRTFLRGIRRTDANGIARFDTVYPDWYPGRTAHLHVKVHVSGNALHAGQLVFSDSLTDSVFARKPYRTRAGERGTSARSRWA